MYALFLRHLTIVNCILCSFTEDYRKVNRLCIPSVSYPAESKRGNNLKGTKMF